MQLTWVRQEYLLWISLNPQKSGAAKTGPVRLALTPMKKAGFNVTQSYPLHRANTGPSPQSVALGWLGKGSGWSCPHSSVTPKVFVSHAWNPRVYWRLTASITDTNLTCVVRDTPGLPLVLVLLSLLPPLLQFLLNLLQVGLWGDTLLISRQCSSRCRETTNFQCCFSWLCQTGLGN